MENKRLLIGAIYHYDIPHIETYVQTAKSVCDNTDKIMICYDVKPETYTYLKDNGWEVYLGHKVGHVHMHRFFDMWRLIEKSNYDLVLSTDVRDVYFQKDPFAWLEQNMEKQIYVASENVSYENEAWNKKNILEGYGEHYYYYLKEKEVGNVGIVAGKMPFISDFFQMIYNVSQGGNTQHFTDQSACNLIIHNELVKPVIQIGHELCMQVGSMVDKNKIEGYENFPLIHQYDRAPKLTKILCELL